LFGAMEFSAAAAKEGIQPIMGLQVDLAHAPAVHPGDRPAPPRPVVLLAQDEMGYANLLALSSANYLDPGEALPHVPLATLT
ncbi:PHP domain-containing protein, partial [Salmonella enterica subsp. enterica serovar 1,4,[5],12:i:-]